MIKLPHGPTKFRSTSFKCYSIDNQKPILDSPVSTQILSAEASPVEIAPTETSQTKISPSDTPSIKHAVKSPSATLVSLVLVKQSHGRGRKYPKQANIAAPLDICFLINESDIFIKNYDAPPTQYTVSK